MSRTLDFLARFFPPVRRARADIVRLREQRDGFKATRDRLQIERDALREQLGLREGARPLTYQQDGLATIHDVGFLSEPKFMDAYAAGVAAAGEDYAWHWRVHIGLWVSHHARQLGGDFVECGVNRGFLSAAIMRALAWETSPKTFYLLDTFTGLEKSQINPEERALGRKSGSGGSYAECYQEVCSTFAKYSNVRIIRGVIPDTLPQVAAERISYLSIDMNCAAPEIAAGEFFWPRLVPGAFVLLDDYAYAGFKPQREAWDDFARRRNTQVLTLPTGQGLLLKT